MAEFVSTTLPTYSDPLRAQSIKALEQRHKEMLAQSAAAGAITPENTQTPIQGFGHLANQLGDSFQRARVDQAAAAQRQMLAQTMAGMDPNNPKPHEIAAINSADPEMARQMMTQLAEYRRAQLSADTQKYGYDSSARSAAEGHDVTRQGNRMQADTASAGQANQAAMETARLEAAEKAAAELARTHEAQKAADEKRLQERPTDLDVVKADLALKRGEIDQATRDAIVQKATGPSAAEQKAGNELQNTHLDTQSAISDLKEARDLLGPKGEGIRSGSGAGWAQTGAKVIGDRLGLTDPTLTQPTERYNQLMSAEAITAMAAKLKGATTDFELKAFVTLMNNTDADPKTKMQALDKMIAKAEAHAALQQEQLKRAKVSAPAGAGGSATATVDPLAEAQDAINRGAPFDAVAARFKGDKSLLKPKGP